LLRAANPPSLAGVRLDRDRADRSYVLTSQLEGFWFGGSSHHTANRRGGRSACTTESSRLNPDRFQPDCGDGGTGAVSGGGTTVAPDHTPARTLRPFRFAAPVFVHCLNALPPCVMMITFDRKP
jgi:hypothetical protein